MNELGDYCPIADCRKIGHTPDVCSLCLKADRDMWKRKSEDLQSEVDYLKAERGRQDKRWNDWT